MSSSRASSSTVGLIPAVTYGRVSTVGQAENGTSLTSQMEICAESVAQNGGYVLEHLSDEGVSGEFYISRPGIQSALAKIERGEAKMLCIHMVDRGGRNVDAVRDIAKRVWRKNGILLIANQGIITPDAIGRFILTSQASAAELLKGIIEDNTTRGRRKKALSGQQPSRSTHPYGYHIVTKADVLRGTYPASELGQYQIVPDQAETVLAIFTRITTGSSIRGVIRWLYEQGIPAPGRNDKPGGPQWQNSTILRLLRNPLYKGEPVWGRTRHDQDEDRLKDGYKSPRFRWLADPSDYVPLTAPAIVSAKMWQQVQDTLDNNQAALGGNPKRKYLLSPFLRCPLCGGRMCGMMQRSSRDKKQNRPGYLYYRCQFAQSRRKMDGTNCRSGHFNGEQIHRMLIAAINALASEPDRIDDAIEAWHRLQNAKQQSAAAAAAAAAEAARRNGDGIEGAEQAVGRLRAELKALDDQMSAAIRAQVVGVAAGADPRFYEEIIGTVATQQREKRAEIEQAESTARKAANPNASTDEARAETSASAARLRSAARAMQQKALTLGELLPLYLKEESIPVTERQGMLSHIIDYIEPTPPEALAKEAARQIRVYFREDLFLPAFTDKESVAVAAEAAVPDDPTRFLLRNGARITLHATVFATTGEIIVSPEILSVKSKGARNAA